MMQVATVKLMVSIALILLILFSLSVMLQRFWTQIANFLRSVTAYILRRIPVEEKGCREDECIQKEVEEVLKIPHSSPENELKNDEKGIADHVNTPAEKLRVGDLTNEIREENVRELVCDRIEQITRRLEDWGVEMADSLAELESLRSDDEFDVVQLKKICAELRRQLKLLDCELIDLDEWNPEKQRAIRVEEGLPPGSTPRITRKVSLGLCVQGRLVRKQEVYIKK